MGCAVHIIDDDANARASLSYMLTSFGYVTQVYESAKEFLSNATDHRGCILLDLRMPDMNGVEFQQELLNLSIFLPVIVISGDADYPSAVRSIKLGAQNFLEKGGSSEELIAEVELAFKTFAKTEEDLRLKSETDQRLARLTRREREVFEGVAKGMTNREMAALLELSPRTVEIHRSNVARKLAARSVADIVRMAMNAAVERGSPRG